MKEDDVKKLITSIRDQTNKLKKTVKDQVITNKSINEKPTANKSARSNHSLALYGNENPYNINDDFQYCSTNKAKKGKIPHALLPLNQLLKNTNDLLNNGKSRTPHRIREDNNVTPDEISFYTPTGHTDKDSYGRTAQFENMVKSDNKRSSVKNVENYLSTRGDDSSAELRQARNTIDSLMYDNKVLTNDIEDCTNLIQFLVFEQKRLYKELDEEKRKNSRTEILENELHQERARNQMLAKKNKTMREKFLKLVEMIQNSSVEDESQNTETEKMMQEILTENQYLRELMRITNISDPEFLNIGEFLAKEEEDTQSTNQTTNESPSKLHLEFADTTPEYKLTKEIISEFKKDRLQKFANKKSLSIDSENSSQQSLSDNPLIQAGNETPILLNHQSPASREGNHINFLNSDSLLLQPLTPGGANKENASDSLASSLFTKGGSLNNSLIGLNTSSSSIVFRNSLDNKIGEK
jgi:hypothetical protein